jgi:hypothetical protein
MPFGRTLRGRDFRALTVSCVLALSLPVWGVDQTASLQSRLAREEIVLAKTPSLYFIVYLKSKVIALRSRGMTLQEWKVHSIHAWGEAPPLGALTLEKKSTLFPPKRAKIKPAAKEEEAASFELEALELKDMPSRFTLFLSGGIRLSIRPMARGFFPRLGNFGHVLAWNLWVPLRNLSFRLRKKPFAAIDIKLEKKEEGQAVYWALPDGVKGLVFPL